MRNNKIDALKGILIILVIAGHVCSRVLIQKNLPLDHLPEPISLSDFFWIVLRNMIEFMIAGFLFISGYLLSRSYSRKDSFEVSFFYKKRLNRIYIPFVVWLSIYMLFWGHPSIYDAIISLVFLGGWFHFWFIWVIFISYLLFPFLLQFIKSHVVLFSITFLIVFAIASLLSNRPLSDSYTLNFILQEKILILPRHLLYFCMGILIGTYFQEDIFAVPKNHLYFLLLLLLYVISLYGKMNNFSHTSYLSIFKNECSTIVFNSVSILLMLRCVNFIEKRFNNITAFLSLMGLASYGVYLSHMAILYIFRDVLDGYLQTTSALYALFSFLGCILGTYLLARLSSNKKIGMFLGF